MEIWHGQVCFDKLEISETDPKLSSIQNVYCRRNEVWKPRVIEGSVWKASRFELLWFSDSPLAHYESAHTGTADLVVFYSQFKVIGASAQGRWSTKKQPAKHKISSNEHHPHALTQPLPPHPPPKKLFFIIGAMSQGAHPQGNRRRYKEEGTIPTEATTNLHSQICNRGYNHFDVSEWPRTLSPGFPG